ncbi:MAG: hypothetical protein KDA81_18710 [Planctomycetaceae bacterium]|nr:hypothetical protein [Planctomycetaceae bacterium]
MKLAPPTKTIPEYASSFATASERLAGLWPWAANGTRLRVAWTSSISTRRSGRTGHQLTGSRRHRTHRVTAEPNWLRHLTELAISFVMAVIVLRAFLLEGYLISTGSMAPGLLGFHKQVTCPSCSYTFAFGVNFDESVDDPALKQHSTAHDYAQCPNCGQGHINVAGVPLNHGDQLLVHKGVFDLRRPRRWETAVFLNPASPGEAYVKRIVGLPGETIQVVDGDLFVEGSIARKDYLTQCDIRIPVFDLACLKKDDDWQMPWRLDGNWSLRNGRLTHQTVGEPFGTDVQQAASISLRYWRATGGTHVSEVAVPWAAARADWEKCLAAMQERPISWITRLQYDREQEVLRLKGVMPYQMQQDLMSWAEGDEFRNAVFRLAALSHLSPVMDRYGYNPSVTSSEYPVRDLMVETSLSWNTAPDVVSVDVPLQSRTWRLEICPGDRTVQLFADDTDQAVRRAELTEEDLDLSKHELKIEVSNFDARILVAVNGRPIFPEVDIPVGLEDGGAKGTVWDSNQLSDAQLADMTATLVERQNRFAIGIRGGDVTVETLRLYRDVYYTPGLARNAIREPLTVQQDCYFVQGDNSPVSADSRNWNSPCVPHHLLVGKPFIVHLPSRPGKLTFAGHVLPLRIPDTDRIRLIH